MICQQCGKKNDPSAVFCVQCSQPLLLSCPSCSTQNPGDALFCMKCRTELGEVSEAAQESRLQDLRDSAPKDLQKKLRLAQSEIEGQRKPVTILFTDIVGSTAIAEKLDPEVWKEIIAGAHRLVGEAVYRYEGTIAQLLGDGVLAFFGAPITHEDDPVRAVRAAMDIQASVEEYGRELAGTIDDFQMRIGINTGTVVVGEIGTDMHVEYLAIGDAVNVAARLQSAAEPGKVVVSEPCARLVSAAFELKDLGEISVKGKAEPLQAFELICVKKEPKTGRGIEGLPTPHVGRAQEVEKLQSSLLALCDGHGQIVTVVGDAGIGKTRLVEEVKATIGEDEGDHQTKPISPSSIRWLEGRALSYGGSLSYWTITQLLLVDLGLSDGAPQVEIIVALRQRVKELFGKEKTDEVLPYLAHLLGLKGEEEAEEHIQSLDGETLKKRTLQSVSDYFGQVANEKPTILVFEDMHWADPSSLEALEGLLVLTDRVPLMILMLMRIDRDHGSWGIKLKAETDFPHRTTEIHLHRLTEGDSSSLLAQLLGETKLPEAIERTIMERSEGNPFYLEEVIRHLMEQDLIVQDEDGWRATEALEEMSIPDTLQGVLLARIDRLEEDVRRTLQMASVIGKSFLYRILETISEAEMQLDTHLSQLQRVDIVREKARLPELEYIFKHALTQEAAYNSLLHERRKVFHQKVGEALEELFPDRVDEFSGLMAYHFEASEAHEKAVDYLLKAGDIARLVYSHQEAIGYYERALVILKDQGKYNRAARTLMSVGLTYHNAYNFERSRQAYDDGFTLWKQTGTAEPIDQLAPASHALRVDWDEPLTLDPAFALDVSSEVVIDQLFSGLVESTPEMDVVPDVAQSWEVSEGGKKYIFHLRDDVHWSDGTPVTAADFEYAWKRMLESISESSNASFLFDVVGARAFHQGESDGGDVGVYALDEATLVVELEGPTGYFLPLLACAVTFPVPRHVVNTHGERWTELTNIVTNGPFKLESWQPGELMVLSRNPEYHGRIGGNLTRIELSLLADPSAQQEMYEVAELDSFHLCDLSMAERDRVRQQHPGEYILVPMLTTDFVGFNVNRPPFDDSRVRRAFVLSTDRVTLADVVLRGHTLPATGGFVPPGMPIHTEGIALPYDPEQARQLLDEAGYKGGRGFPDVHGLAGLGRETEMEYLQTEWKENLGVNIRLEAMESAMFFKRVTNDPPHIWFQGWVADYPDPDSFLRTSAFQQLTGWQNETYTKLVEEARRVIHKGERMKLYNLVEKILVEEAPIMPYAYRCCHCLMKPWVKKIPRSALGTWFWKDVILEPH